MPRGISSDGNDGPERAVAEVLERIGWAGPAVDALAVAGRLGVAVLVDRQLTGRARCVRVGGRPAIVIRPDPRPERRQWSVAHELGELQAIQGRESAAELTAGASTAAELSRWREDWANAFAQRLLLPARWFFPAAEEFVGNIVALKDRFPTASHELIAVRLLDLPQPSVISIFDQGRLTRRRGNCGPPGGLTPAERTCWEQVRRTRQPCQQEAGGCFVAGWAIDEPGWQRELLRVTLTDESAMSPETRTGLCGAAPA